MMIESTYKRNGKGAGSIIGTATKPRSVQIWSNSLPSCNDLLSDLDELRGRYSTQKIIHKEVAEARTIADMKDRNALKRTLQSCTHPFDMTSHDPSVLMNIYSGKISLDESNVHKSVETGNKQMKEFQRSLPDGFYAALPKKAITMENKKTKLKVVEVYNTELIYFRAMCLLSVDPISLEDLFNYELVPVPTSLFTDTDEPRYRKSKSTLKKKLKVEVSTRTHDAGVIILDGWAGLYHIHWPKDARVRNVMDSFIKYGKKHWQVASVYLIDTGIAALMGRQDQKDLPSMQGHIH